MHNRPTNALVSLSLEELTGATGGAGPVFGTGGMSPTQFSQYNRGLFNTKDVSRMLQAPVGHLEMTPSGLIFGNRPFAR